MATDLNDKIAEQVARVPEPDIEREYVAAGLQSSLSQAISALPRYSDDLTREQGDGVYERMRADSAVNTALQTLIEVVLGNDVKIECAIADDTDPQYDLAQEVAEFVAYNLARLSRPLTQCLTEMFDAYVFGCAAAEKVYEVQRTRQFGLRLHLNRLRPIARDAFSFVVDLYGNVIGLAVRGPDSRVVPTYIDPEQVVRRDKFAILQFGVSGSDPRGRSQIRSAYNAWWFKMQTFPRWLKFLQQFASPSLVGYTPAGEDELVDLRQDDGTPVLDNRGRQVYRTREQVMLDALIQFQSGSAMALKGGSRVEPITSSGEGQAFIATIDALNREIFMAIAGTPRVNMEAAHGSKADSESSQDSVSRKGDWIRKHFDDMLYRDVARHLVALNWGEQVADSCTPNVTLYSSDKEDFAKVAAGVSALWEAGYYHKPSQVQGLDTILDAPARDMDAWLQDYMEEKDRRAQNELAQQRISLPGQGLPEEPYLNP